MTMEILTGPTGHKLKCWYHDIWKCVSDWSVCFQVQSEIRWHRSAAALSLRVFGR
jgi:hypothetical protein